MKSSIKLIGYLFIVLMGVSCSSDDEGMEPEDTGRQSITAKIDGRDFEAVMPNEQYPDAEFIVTNPVIYPNGSGFVLAISGVDVSWEDAAAVDIRVILIGPNLSSLKAGTIFTNRGTDTEPTFDGYVAAGVSTMVLNNMENAYIALTDDFGTIQVEVTSIDHSAKQISGTFEFTAVDLDEERTVVVTAGEFKNISW